jgi:hypothetical protein
MGELEGAPSPAELQLRDSFLSFNFLPDHRIVSMSSRI